MSAAEHQEPVDVAIGFIHQAHRKAMTEARAQPESTWIDAACSIGAAEAQLLASQPGVFRMMPLDLAGGHTCIALLKEAEQSLAQIPAGLGPVTLALIRAYLTDAIVETAGRES